MITASWNCQGLRNTRTVRRLRELRFKLFPDIMFLTETKNQDEYVNPMKDLLGFDCIYTVAPVGLSGGLALLWMKEVELQVLEATSNYIDARVKYQDSFFFLTCVYGAPAMQDRVQVWNQISERARNKEDAWLLMGDFNDILVQEEKRGGPMRHEGSFVEFRSFVSQNGLWDLQHSRNPLSWRGMRHNYLIHARLDRAMGNNALSEMFPSGRMKYLRFESSDHRPIIIKLDASRAVKKGQFYFDNRLRERDEVFNLIEEIWSNDASSLDGKFSACRRAIIRWSREQNLNSALLIKQTREELDLALSNELPDQSRIEELKEKLEKAYIEEEKFWKQRSRVLWLHSGDKNTAFFYASTRNRRTLNRLTVLENDRGVAYYKEGDIAAIIAEYYQNLFASNGNDDFSVVDEALKPLITQQWNEQLIKIPSEEEVYLAAKDIHAGKAAGPDGFSSGFFHSYWMVIKDDVIREVRKFFTTSCFPNRMNVTNIRLIPKIAMPTKVSEYRPIALCNVFYKIVAKIMTKRLQEILPFLISENQTAFVPGRAISDNVLITHEVLHYLRRSKAKVRVSMAVKTDMMKAYDRIEWKFLEAVLRRLGFHEIWIKWVMECVTTVSYSFLINGSPQGKVIPTRGLRQGDPLSPYLFILCSEVLSGLCRKAQEDGSLPGIKVSKHSPQINHLLFADDTMFFCKSDEESCRTLGGILKSYESASGQAISLEKSSITFSSKTPTARRVKAKQLLKINQEGGNGKYLGLPEHFGRRKRDIFTSIVDRIRQRSHSWSTKCLSAAGKEVMLQSVLSAMPSYAMSCFKLPKSLTDRIQSVLTRFWWDDKPDKKKTCWVAWEKLVKPKEDGGLGFRDLEMHNDALLAKLSWRIFKYPQSLVAKILLGKYCHASSFMDCTVPSTASHGWKGVMVGREVLRKGLGWIVRSGREVGVWSDPWLSLEEPMKPIGPVQQQHLNMKVSELIIEETGEWDLNSIQSLLPMYEERILKLPRVRRHSQDVITWLATKNGIYSAKSGYNLLLSEVKGSSSSDFIWNKNILQLHTTPKIKMFLWKAMVGAIPVGQELARRGMESSLLCRRCGRIETIDHCLLSCPFAQKVWEIAPISMRHFQSPPTFSLLLEERQHFKNLPPLGLVDPDLYAWVCWELWKSRNLLLFENKSLSEEETITKAITYAREWQKAQLQVGHRNRPPAPSSEMVYPPGILCFVDAAWKSGSEVCGIGVVLMSSVERIESQVSDVKRNVTSALMAEAWALLRGLEEAKIKDLKTVHFYSDSQVLITCLNNKVGRVEISNYLADIQALAQDFHKISFSFVPRLANVVADAVAKRTLQEFQTLSHFS